MMNEPDPLHRPGVPVRPALTTISWPLVIGLASLGLLWPLTGLLGLADLLGGATRAFLLLVIIAMTWVGVVGMGRLARPIATLALAGVMAGIFITLTAVILGDISGGRSVMVAIWTISWQSLFGVVAGALALGVQRVRA